jgi:hypothetical protein
VVLLVVVMVRLQVAVEALSVGLQVTVGPDRPVSEMSHWFDSFDLFVSH